MPEARQRVDHDAVGGENELLNILAAGFPVRITLALVLLVASLRSPTKEQRELIIKTQQSHIRMSI